MFTREKERVTEQIAADANGDNDRDKRGNVKLVELEDETVGIVTEVEARDLGEGGCAISSG